MIVRQSHPLVVSRDTLTPDIIDAPAHVRIAHTPTIKKNDHHGHLIWSRRYRCHGRIIGNRNFVTIIMSERIKTNGTGDSEHLDDSLDPRVQVIFRGLFLASASLFYILRCQNFSVFMRRGKNCAEERFFAM